MFEKLSEIENFISSRNKSSADQKNNTSPAYMFPVSANNILSEKSNHSLAGL